MKMRYAKRQQIEQNIRFNKRQRYFASLDPLPLAIQYVIYSCMSVNDLSNLAMTSRSFQNKVHFYRGQGDQDCYVYREERVHTRVSFEAPQNELSVTPMYQQRPFRFLVRSKRYILLVEMSLNNLLWKETGHDGIGLYEEDNSGTIVQFKVMRQLVYQNSSVEWQLLFQRHLSWIVPRYANTTVFMSFCKFHQGNFCRYCTGFFLTGFTDEDWKDRKYDPNSVEADDGRAFVLSPVSETYLKESVAAIILCSKRIACFPDPFRFYPCSGHIASDALLSKKMIELFSPRYFDPAEVTRTTIFDDESEVYFQREINYQKSSSPSDWFLQYNDYQLKPFEHWWREVEVSSPVVLTYLDTCTKINLTFASRLIHQRRKNMKSLRFRCTRRLTMRFCGKDMRLSGIIRIIRNYTIDHNSTHISSSLLRDDLTLLATPSRFLIKKSDNQSILSRDIVTELGDELILVDSNNGR
jgi:hypothetical protein